jgi:succinate dehydrogenase / fumarate reductase flavoprotein subunit
MVTGPALAAYRSSLGKSSWDLSSSFFDKAEKREQKKYDAILAMDGDENAYEIHAELGQTMLLDCTIERHNDKLDGVLSKIEELADRTKNVGVTDTSARSNQGAQFVRHLKNMLVIARVIAQGARNRDESRGAHFKPAHTERDDANWLRTTMAIHTAADDGVHDTIKYVRSLDYDLCGASVHVTDAVDTSLVKPRPRKYETAGAASAVAAHDTKTPRVAPSGGSATKES